MDVQSFQIQALITFITPLLIQLAKRSKSAAFAWIDQRRPTVCVITSGVAALLTSMGIEIVHAPHSLTVSWPESATLARGLVTFLVAAMLQFVAQHALYEKLWREVVPSPGSGQVRLLTADSSRLELTADSSQLTAKGQK